MKVTIQNINKKTIFTYTNIINCYNGIDLIILTYKDGTQQSFLKSESKVITIID